MSFSNPIQIVHRPVFNETSPLISKREAGHPSRQWIRHRDNTAQLDAMARNIRLLQFQLDSLKKRGGADSDATTIRVYLCGDGVNEAGYYLLQGVRDPDQTPA